MKKYWSKILIWLEMRKRQKRLMKVVKKNQELGLYGDKPIQIKKR